MIEAQLAEAVTQLHLTAVETLNRLLKSETDPAELRRLLTIAVRVRHPATERPKPRTAPSTDADTHEPVAAVPAPSQPAPGPAAKPSSHHRRAIPARDELDSSAAFDPVPVGRAAQTPPSPPQAPPLSGRHP